jgi:mRNA-degrading endonuclease toxin of MazEF toxin-antitoxin module
MAKGGPQLRRGRIVWTEILDHNGHAKRRPAVILTPTSEIKEGAPFVVVAVTTTYPDPAPDDHVELPWHNAKHPVTRLTQRSAAVVSWLNTIMPEQVEGFAGDTPAKQMKAIEEKLDQLPE